MVGQIRNLNGYLFVSLNFSLVNITQLPRNDCWADGLSWHLHTAWTHTDSLDKIGAADCSATYTSGHYDPWFGCGSATSNTVTLLYHCIYIFCVCVGVCVA